MTRPLTMPVCCVLIDCRIKERGMDASFCGARSLGDTNGGHQQPASHKARNHITGVSRASSAGLEA
jgi:hypothetical protein